MAKETHADSIHNACINIRVLSTIFSPLAFPTFQKKEKPLTIFSTQLNLLLLKVVSSRNQHLDIIIKNKI